MKKQSKDFTANLKEEIAERRYLEEVFGISEKTYQTLVDNLPQKVFLKDHHSVYILCNHRFAEELNIHPAEILGKTDYDLFSKDAADKYTNDDRRVMEQGLTETLEETYIAGDRRGVVQTIKTPVRDEYGRVVGVLGIFWDITERKQADERQDRLLAQIDQQRQLLNTVLSASADLVFMHDRAGRYIFASDPALRALDLEKTAMEGKTWRELGFLAEVMGSFDAELESVFATGKLSTNEIRFPTVDGMREFETILTPVYDADGAVTAVVSTVRDVTERKAYEARLEYQANYDDLTQLPNRRLLEDRLGHALAHAGRNGHAVAVLFLDLDRFKTVIDSLGYAPGDVLLQTVATRLKDSVREGDTVARVGGNEFVIVLEELPREDLADAVARNLQEAINTPFQVQRHELFITASIGISLYPRDGDDVQTLLKNAHAALHRTKKQGRNGIQFYTTEMNDQAGERLNLELALRHALNRDELELHYQPQVDLQTGQVIGAEALLRWRHPQWGLVPPAKFIRIAEETGLIIPIGEWTIRKACAQAKAWQDRGLSAVRVAVNLSTRQFLQPGLIDLIAQILEETGLEAGYLELEITESLLMQDVECSIALLRTLKSMGVSLSIDDFGTGYSSLNYLKRFPIDRLKIDKSFVQEITTNPEDAAIALAIISMAHSLKLRVIAEGVETEGQLCFLKSRRCDELQGYYVSPPLPVQRITGFLEDPPALPLASPEETAAAPPTLLLVDDEPNVLLALRRILSRDGYRILTAGSGREGLELLARHPVDVVVADQLMPEMKGTDFLRRVREIYPDIVRIVLSGHSDIGTLIEAINEGAIYKFLAKPVPEHTLRITLREAVLLYRTQQRHQEIS